MKYQFPYIQTIDDVMHAFDDNFFVKADRGDHIIINYLFSSPETFPDVKMHNDIASIRREFRGLIFDEAGNIIRRPFHKFFNVGERLDTQLQNIDVSADHVIYHKLDGSMIVPYKVGMGVIWGTKMGNTDVAQQVHKFVHENRMTNYIQFVDDCLNRNYSPIFEWCSRQQRIVLDYPNDQLILTAMRHMHTGQYVNNIDLVRAAKQYNIDVCGTTHHALSQHFVNLTKNEQDVEGYVIRFNDGHMAKIKCDWYVALHRVKSEIAFERGVVQLLLNDSMDDIKPLMSKDDLKEVEDYETAFFKAFRQTVIDVVAMRETIEKFSIDRKTYALKFMNKNPLYMNHIVFKLWDQVPSLQNEVDTIKDMLKEIILQNCIKNSKFKEFRKTKLFDNVPYWRGIDINE